MTTNTDANNTSSPLTVDEKRALIDQSCRDHNIGGWMYKGNYDITDEDVEEEWTKTTDAIVEAHGGTADVTDSDVATLIAYGLERCALQLD